MAGSDFRYGCFIYTIVTFTVMLSVVGGTLIGTAQHQQFVNPGDPQFIAGFSLLMLLTLLFVNVICYYFIATSDDGWVVLIMILVNIFTVFLIVGATLVGISPQAFHPPNSMFITGFTFLIIDAIIFVITTIMVCFTTSCCYI
jgi:hypothetical protein